MANLASGLQWAETALIDLLGLAPEFVYVIMVCRIYILNAQILTNESQNNPAQGLGMWTRPAPRVCCR